MIQYTQTYLDAITGSQEVALSAATAWADHVQQTWDSAFAQITAEPQVPNLVELVNATFDNLEKRLGLQRDFYAGIAQAYAPLVEQVAADVKTAADTLTAKA